VATSPVLTEIDFAKPGKQIGTFRVPYSRNSSAWGVVPTPIAVIQNGDGPTVYLNAGTHGGEPEGTVCLCKLMREIEPEHIQGRLIITPALNLLAVRAGERLCPADQKDLNRVFPGNPRGTLSQVIAHYVAEHIVPLADAVIDLHSGGLSLQLLPYASMHYLEDRALHTRTFAAMRAFGAPYSLLVREFSGPGLLDYEVESRGKVFLCPELGSAGVLELETLSIAETGVRNALKHFGLLQGGHAERDVPDLTANKLIEVPDPAHYYAANSGGIYEPFVTLGCTVNEGQPLGQLHGLDNFIRAPEIITAVQTGILLGRRAPGITEVGDCVAVIARPVVPV
jgi:N-alpha-acetyl-L-2,4-diaminobutyrate deacetylase